MTLTQKICFIIILLVVIFLWNRVVPRHLIQSVNDFHRHRNKNNIDKQPIKFFLDNEKMLIRMLKMIYWFGFMLMSYTILFEEN